MRIILKPVGAILVVSVIVVLALLAFFQSRQRKPDTTQNPGETTPRVVSAEPKEPWHVDAAQNTVERMQLGTENGQYDIAPDFLKTPISTEAGSFTVKVQAKEVGKTSKFPKYGIVVRGQQDGDRAEAWIDPPTHVLATTSTSGKVRNDWRNTALPADFDPKQQHELQISWSAGGKKWQFTVDNDKASQQTAQFDQPIAVSGVSLITEDVTAVYRQIAVK